MSQTLKQTRMCSGETTRREPGCCPCLVLDALMSWCEQTQCRRAAGYKRSIWDENFVLITSLTPRMPCVYICCHYEISDDHHGPVSRPKATTRAIQDGRRVSRRHSHHRERHRESLRNRKRSHSRNRSRSSSVSRPYQSLVSSILTTTLAKSPKRSQRVCHQPPRRH